MKREVLKDLVSSYKRHLEESPPNETHFPIPKRIFSEILEDLEKVERDMIEIEERERHKFHKIIEDNRNKLVTQHKQEIDELKKEIDDLRQKKTNAELNLKGEVIRYSGFKEAVETIVKGLKL